MTHFYALELCILLNLKTCIDLFSPNLHKVDNSITVLKSNPWGASAFWLFSTTWCIYMELYHSVYNVGQSENIIESHPKVGTRFCSFLVFYAPKWGRRVSLKCSLFFLASAQSTVSLFYHFAHKVLFSQFKTSRFLLLGKLIYTYSISRLIHQTELVFKFATFKIKI